MLVCLASLNNMCFFSNLRQTQIHNALTLISKVWIELKFTESNLEFIGENAPHLYRYVNSSHC